MAVYGTHNSICRKWLTFNLPEWWALKAEQTRPRAPLRANSVRVLGALHD